MKKNFAVVFMGTLFFVTAFASCLWAQGMQEGGDNYQQDSRGMENFQGNGPMGGGMRGRSGMNPGMMGGGNSSMVATSDGGVVILSGPRLMKYDRTLTLVKEIELPKPKAPSRQRQNSENETANSAPEENNPQGNSQPNTQW